MRLVPFFFLWGIIFPFESFSQADKKSPVDLVYPYLDAANSRWFYFSSACRPFGMVSLFPDTKVDGEWDSGYRYTEDSIRCFSHIHEWQLSGVAVMPVVFDKVELPSLFKNYATPFSHDNEKVSPGYHEVLLDRYNTRVSLTASNRVGFHKYDFPTNMEKSVGVIFDLGGQLGPSEIIEGGFQQVSDYQITGYVVNGPTIRRAQPCPIFFSVTFYNPIKNIHHYQNGKVVSGDIESWEGKGGKILVEFDKDEGTVLMKVGVSFTSVRGASNNLLNEIPRWDFDQAKEQAHKQWNNMLSRIIVSGGSEKQQIRFYTDLWHAIQGRRIISDIDGQYSDNTGKERKIRQVPLTKEGRPSFNMYNSDAFWGAQWTLNTLWQLVYPEIAEDFCNAFIEYYKNGGLIPRGPSGGGYTYVMTGASSTPFFVSAWQKGLRGFDINTAYEGLKKNHLPGGMMSKAGYEHFTTKGGGIEAYIRKGYVPYPLSSKQYGYHQDGAGMTLEYAYQDWTLAQLAKALGKKDDFQYFNKRSLNYGSLFNTQTGYMHPRDSNGRWMQNFDPLQYDHGFIEGNAAQFSWFVPHDLQNLFTLMGGKDSAVSKLNRQFEISSKHRFCNEHPEKNPKFVNEKRTWINYSNQPNSQSAFIFNHAGAPWLTQHWSRAVVDSAYSEVSPYRGYNGDEDQGLMGALSVLMKIGLFQMTGGCEENPIYEIGSPIFDLVMIRLNPAYYKGKDFVISTINNGAANRFIEGAELNGRGLNRYYVGHGDIIKGGKLVLTMSDCENKEWGIGD